jgi:hypothetical protein
MRRWPVVAMILLLAACADAKPKPAPLTQRQHDSVLGASGVPGASGIRGAMRVADSANARNTRLDSISRP